MLLNQFSVRVTEGAELNGYVEMTDGQEYSLHLRNMNSVPCDAEVEIDGKGVGTFRIYAQSSMVLERPSNDQGHFTFAALGSQKASEGQLDANNPSLGLISVTFTPGRIRPTAKPVVEVRNDWNTDKFNENDVAYASAGMGTPRSYSPTNARGEGGTVLTGHSNQQFTSAEPLEYDYSRKTTIHLRLVSRGTTGTARPLTSSTPIPPRIG